MPSKRNITGSLSEFGKKQAHINKIFSQDLTNTYSKFKKEEKTKESHLRRTLCISSTSGSFQSFSTLQIDLDQIGKMPRRPESWYNYPQIREHFPGTPAWWTQISSGLVSFSWVRAPPEEIFFWNLILNGLFHTLESHLINLRGQDNHKTEKVVKRWWRNATAIYLCILDNIIVRILIVY